MDQTGLNPVVQRMIDAGESEENIATVIQHYTAQSTPYVPDSPLAHHLNEQEGGGDWGQRLSDAGQSLAHPQTKGDIAGLLIPSGGAEVIGNALRPIGQAISKYGGAATKLAGSAATALMPSSMVAPARAALNVLGELKPSEWNSPLTVAGREGRAHAAVAGMVERYKPNIGGAIDGGIPQGDLPQAAPVSSSATTSLSDADRALLAKKYPGLDPAKVDQQLRTAPTDRPPITVSPESAMQPDSPLQQPRAQVGAEQVGRQNGLTTQQVRDTTGPIRGEAPGAAAGMPSRPMDRIVQKLIDMGPKGQGLPEAEREAYAAAGTSDKTRVQVQAYLDALRRVGFIAPLAAAPDAIRGRLVQMIRGPEQD